MREHRQVVEGVIYRYRVGDPTRTVDDRGMSTTKWIDQRASSKLRAVHGACRSASG